MVLEFSVVWSGVFQDLSVKVFALGFRALEFNGPEKT